MINPENLTEVTTGILAVLILNFSAIVIREVMNFRRQQRNGGGDHLTTIYFNKAMKEDYLRREEVWSQLSETIKQGDIKIAQILDNQTTILRDLMNLIATHHHSSMLSMQDIEHHFTVFTDDIARILQKQFHAQKEITS